VGIKCDYGTADPGAAVTWPDTKIIAWLCPNLAHCLVMYYYYYYYYYNYF